MHIKLVVRDGSLREAMIDIELPDTVGGEYLSKLKVKASRDRERQTKARALSVQVHKLFNPLEEEVSCKKVAPEGMLIDIAHLIDSKSVSKSIRTATTPPPSSSKTAKSRSAALASLPLPARKAAHRQPATARLHTNHFHTSPWLPEPAMGLVLLVLASECIEYALLCTSIVPNDFRCEISILAICSIL